jgi:hypothetical protein
LWVGKRYDELDIELGSMSKNTLAYRKIFEAVAYIR